VLPLFRCVMIDFLVLDHLGIPVGRRNKEAFAGEKVRAVLGERKTVTGYTLSIYVNMYLLYINRLNVKF
jgi:hypothetical protein